MYKDYCDTQCKNSCVPGVLRQNNKGRSVVNLSFSSNFNSRNGLPTQNEPATGPLPWIKYTTTAV